jgi:uncharacterized damage-inducible protein DinB
MTTKTMIVNEFERRLFEESYSRIFKCLSLLNEESIWFSPNNQIPSVGNLILHLCGNARQWVLSGIGGSVDNRNREQEFVVQKNIKKSELIFLLENLKVNLKTTILEMPDSALNERKIIQGFEETGFSILIHVIEHFSYHTGQITTLTKMITNKQTGYYHGFNLNQLN